MSDAHSAHDGAPDLLGPLRAWRVWSVEDTPDGWRLSSIHHRQIWEPETETEAWCYRSSGLALANRVTHDRHLAPVAGCQCGIYGADDVSAAGEYLVRQHASYESMYVAARYRHRVVGQIELWGRTLECARGYRATYGYPTRLWIPTQRPDGRSVDVAGIALDLVDYGVPVSLVDGGTRDEILKSVAAEAA